MGFLRLFLALSVVVAHVGGKTLFGMPIVPSFMAVNIFYIISGFYMALVLNEKYASARENGLFYGNRALRIYPLYFVSLLLVLLVYRFDANPGYLASRVADLPQGLLATFGIAFSNLFILGLDFFYPLCDATNAAASCTNASMLTINPPAWSISSELMFYAAAPFILRSRWRSLCLLGAGIAYLSLVRELPGIGDVWYRFVYAYYFFPASLLFFGVGACAYHFVLPWLRRRRAAASPLQWLMLLLLMTVALDGALTVTPQHWIVGAFVAIPALFWLTRRNRLDRLVGELSYPVYILHFPVMEALFRLFHPEISDGMAMAPLAVAVTLLLAVAAMIFLDRPLDRYRQRRLARTHSPAPLAPQTDEPFPVMPEISRNDR